MHVLRKEEWQTEFDPFKQIDQIDASAVQVADAVDIPDVRTQLRQIRILNDAKVCTGSPILITMEMWCLMYETHIKSDFIQQV